MAKLRYKKQLECIHGIPKSDYCPACEVDNVYIKNDLKSYNDTYDRRRVNNFALAFRIKANFNKWKRRYTTSSIDYYLRLIEEAGKSSLDPNTLKHAYYVSKAFPDLETVCNRKLSFSAYSEIANSRITKEDKRLLRKQLEEAGSVTVDKIRNIIAKKIKGRTIKERFKLKSTEELLSAVVSFIKENAEHYDSNIEVIVTMKTSKNPLLSGRAVDEDAKGRDEDRI